MTNAGATVTHLASITDPTTQTYSTAIVMADGRVAINYDDPVNPAPDLTSQYLFNIYDLRTAGITVSGLTGTQDNYIAGTHYNDTVAGESGVNNEYYFVGQNSANGPEPTDHFTGGGNGSNGWNVAIFADARADYTISTDGSFVTTVASNGLDPLHTGSLVASNVQVLAFGPSADPLPHNGIIDVNGGTDVILGGNGAITIEAGATAEIDSVASGSGPYTGLVTFEAATGTLALDQPYSFTGQIAGISGSGNVLDLAGFDAAHHTVAATSGSYSAGTTTLTVTDSSNAANPLHLTLTGDYSASTWTVTSDGHGGANIVDPPAPTSSNPGPVIMHDPGPAASDPFPASTTIAATGINQNLTGTGPSDTFVFDFAAVGHATVTNFRADSDLLQFKASMFTNVQVILDATGDDGHGNSVIALDDHDSITLLGVTKAQLHQTDFHLA